MSQYKVKRNLAVEIRKKENSYGGMAWKINLKKQ